MREAIRPDLNVDRDPGRALVLRLGHERDVEHVRPHRVIQHAHGVRLGRPVVEYPVPPLAAELLRARDQDPAYTVGVLLALLDEVTERVAYGRPGTIGADHYVGLEPASV